MQSINALSLAPDVKDWLANSRQSRILHVFDHACNLINERREVLSIVTPQIGNGPFNLVIEEDGLFSNYLSLQSQVRCVELVETSNSSNHLNLGDFAIHTTDAKLWFPRPDWEMLYAKRDEILNQLISLPITNYQKYGFDTPLDDHSRLLNHRQLPITQSPVPSLQSPILQFPNSLISFIATADIQSSKISVGKLAGLGQGLTPAGDDFILGAVLAAWIIHPADVASVLAEEITNTAAPLTTSLSAAWLRSAGQGAVGILWHEFFDTLIADKTSNIQLQITRLLSVGETSGADALAGFFGVCAAFNERIIDECPS